MHISRQAGFTNMAKQMGFYKLHFKCKPNHLQSSIKTAPITTV